MYAEGQFFIQPRTSEGAIKLLERELKGKGIIYQNLDRYWFGLQSQPFDPAKTSPVEVTIRFSLTGIIIEVFGMSVVNPTFVTRYDQSKQWVWGGLFYGLEQTPNNWLGDEKHYAKTLWAISLHREKTVIPK